ncbi:MAG TPA: hypothetical protein VNG12_02080, partial [Acidimicrobiales bacterium]|nr:hypothetical protein [Acidimicrobiales bacterium]
MTSIDYISLQARFRDAVIHNQVQFDPLWQRPCLAYNIHARPDRVCRDRLAAVQAEFSRLGEPGLLGCPAGSLHVSVAFLLFVRRDYAEAKESLWASHGSRWIADLTSFLETVQPFTLSYERVLVTDAAVLALADWPPALDAIRDVVAALRSACRLDDAQPSIVHTTLFRFGEGLRNPAGLLESAERIR